MKAVSQKKKEKTKKKKKQDAAAFITGKVPEPRGGHPHPIQTMRKRGRTWPWTQTFRGEDRYWVAQICAN